MKSMILILCAALALAGTVLAGTSGVSSSVTKMTPMAIGEHGFLSKQVDLNTAVITKLDAMTTTDGLEPENLNSGLVPSDVVIGSSTVSNKTMKLWLPNGTLTVSNIVTGVVLPVTGGGTGAGTLTDGGILLGSGTGAITALGVAANGQIPIGDGTTDPVLATITATAGETEISNGAGTITVGLPSAVYGVTTVSNKTMKLWMPNGSATITNVTVGALTASQLVLTDSGKTLTSSATVPADSVNKAALSAVDYGDFTADSDGNCTLDADVVAAAEMADADHGDISWSSGVASVDAGAIDDAKLAAATVGTAGADASKTHGATALKYVELTITSTNLATLADGAHGGGTLEYTFPAGLIYIVGATATGTVVNSTNFNASAADTYSFGVGTATAGDDDALSSTEQNIISVVTVDTASGSKASQVIYGVSSAAVVVDGTSTAAKVYVNYAVADANNHAANTFGTSAMKVKIWYVNLGDI